MAAPEQEEVNLPWGKFSYSTEGLATACYMEGTSKKSYPLRSRQPPGQRLLFRVELPARCFVLSVAVKLPNAPQSALVALEHIEIERSLKNGEYETVYDGYTERKKSQDSTRASAEHSQPIAPITETSRKKVMEIRRAADTLRVSMIDVDDGTDICSTSPLDCAREESDNVDLRMLGVVVVGYVRGQTPAPNRLSVLLECSAKLGIDTAKADRAEVDALLGLAILGHRRYRQAAELLQSASELTLQVAREDQESGFAVEDAIKWAAELNLLSAHAHFEHMPMSNDGIIRLVHVASASSKSKKKKTARSPRDIRNLSEEFLDLRTELLSMLENLIEMLVLFLGESNSLAVKLASTRMIEFVSEQLGCAIARHMGEILNQVLRSYPGCMPFGARERAAAASFSYDSMEDCFERLITICCRIFPLTEHSVLLRMYESTLIPVFLDGFHESDYLYLEEDAEEVADELMTTAVAHTLRIIYLALNILSSDARVPPSLVSRVLNILKSENGNPPTPLLLRRTALHAWDAISKALLRAASGCPVKTFCDHLRVLTDYLPKLLVEVARPDFQYKDVDEDGDGDHETRKEEESSPVNGQSFSYILQKRRKRVEIVDRHTFRRLIRMIQDLYEKLEPEFEEDRSLDVTLSLLGALGESTASLFISGLVDVSYHEAAASGNGLTPSFEYGSLSNQLLVVCDVLGDLFKTFWGIMRLLPPKMVNEVIRTSPVNAVLGWCVDRMTHSSPPKGMLSLLCVAVKGLGKEMDEDNPIYEFSPIKSAPHDIPFLAIYRAALPWLPQTLHEEMFDLVDTLHGIVSEHLMAGDLALLIKGLGVQSECFQARTEVSLEIVAEIVASTSPKNFDLAVSSLKARGDQRPESQQSSKYWFPSTSRSKPDSRTRMMYFTGASSHPGPLAQSLYLHVIFASCFDLFDALTKAASQRAGPSFMGEKIDGFVEHAALCVRCLHACAQKRRHRQYVGAKLGDIFGTCLAMQDHNDGRVRLAGFEIFAAALDVLFLAQNITSLVPGDPILPSSGTGIPSSATSSTQVSTHESMNGKPDVKVFENISKEALHNASNSVPPSEASRSLSPSVRKSSSRTKMQNRDYHNSALDDDGVDPETEEKIELILEAGGSCSFRWDTASNTNLNYEERGWQVLCHFVTGSLGVGKYVDFVVQRACLEYLKGCMMNALCGRSSGAQVITFEHIGLLWEAVYRLIGSPWRTLNALAMWVICTILNVAIYSSIMPRKRGLARQKSSQLNEFLARQVFPVTESMLKHPNRETRIWGMRVLEAYIKARNMNRNVMKVAPPPPGRLLRGLGNLKHDWCESVRESYKSLIEINCTILGRDASMQSLSAQAQSFMTMRRSNLDELEGHEPNVVELWFPPLPQQVPPIEMDLYCRTLEAFANTEIEGGEETELARAVDEQTEVDYGEGYEEDEEIEGHEVEESLVPPEEVENEEILEQHSDQTSEVMVEKEHTNEYNDTASKSTDPSGKHKQSAPDSPKALVEEMGTHFEGDDGLILANPENRSDEISRTADRTSKHEEFATMDNSEDHEFSSLSAQEASSALTQPEMAAHQLRELASGDSEEDEEVVSVTHEDDVVFDVDDAPAQKKLLSASQVDQKSTRSQTITGAVQQSRPSTDPSQRCVPKPELNPDLDEGRQMLRRVGSFTSRPTTGIQIGEGDAPKLARRRSMDVGKLPIIADVSGEKRGPFDSEGQLLSTSPRLLRRKSMKAPASSPRTLDGGRTRIGDSLADSNHGKENVEESGPSSSPLRTKPKWNTPTSSNASSDIRLKRASREASRDNFVGGAFLALSPKRTQVPRGVALDEEVHAVEVHPSLHQVGQKHQSEPIKLRSRMGSSSKTGRRLPRAPAFVKGVGPQRKNQVKPPIGQTRNAAEISAEERIRDSQSSKSVGDLLTPVISRDTTRPILPRARSLVGRKRFESRPESRGERSNTNRSHRYSRREPFGPAVDISDVVDTEVIADPDFLFEDYESLESQINLDAHGPEASNSQNLSTGASSSYKRRAAKRNVGDATVHGEILQDQSRVMKSGEAHTEK